MNEYNDPKGHAGSLKTPLGLIPPSAMEQVAWAHKLGADKYGPWNWRKTGVCASTYVNAIMRHLNAWRDGEDLDPESGFSHLAHIACSCNILMDAAKVGKLQDDRNKLPTNGEVEEDSPVNGMTDEEFDRIIASLRGDLEDFGFELSIDDVPEPDTVPEYRILKAGELIQEGDEFYNKFDNEWIETSLLTSDQIKVGTLSTNEVYRRKITDCDLKEDPSIKYRVETVAYRRLEKDERLRTGDEVYVGEGHWSPVYYEYWQTPAYVNNGIYRRKVADCDLKEEPANHESTVQVTTEGVVYRILDDDETIKVGDEFYVARDRSWNKTTIGEEWGIRPADVNNLFRRKITNCDHEEEPATCDSNSEPQDMGECTCGRRYIYHWLYGWLCEDCELKYNEPY